MAPVDAYEIPHRHLVDHTGTRKLGKTGSGADLPDIPIDIVPASPTAELEYQVVHVA